MLVKTASCFYFQYMHAEYMHIFILYLKHLQESGL